MAIIDKPSNTFNIKLYTGTGSSNAVTGVNFLPAFTWIKSRTTYSDFILTDVARGVTKTIHSNSTAAQTTEAQDLKSFDSDGFTVGTNNNVNKSSDNMLSWNWKGGTTSGIATNGSTTITPSAYSFDQTAGFSVVAYTGNQTAGAKLAHGLGVKPDWIICKSSAGTGAWGVYHKSLGATYAVLLNSTAVKDNDATAWNDVEPDAVNITLGSSINTNKTGTCVAYAFAEKQGYSKFGSWIGNGTANNGAFVYTGFKPAFVLVKSADGITEWFITDDKRPGYNANYRINPNIMDAEATAASANYCDLLSNGFKVRYTDVAGEEQIYMAFAENPFVTSTGNNSIPTTAR